MNHVFNPVRGLFIAICVFIALCFIIVFLPVILLVLLIYLIFFRYTLKRKIDQFKGAHFYGMHGNTGFPRGGTRPPSSATQEEDHDTIDAEYTVLDDNRHTDKN